jgi:methionyl-tRNA formyltransferase
MNDNQSRKVALFVCHELIGLLMLNKAVPAMKAMGLTPVIFNATTRRNRKARRPAPPIVGAFNVQALDQVIIPLLEKERREGDQPNLTYRQLAEKYGLEYHEIENPNDPALVKQLADDKSFVGAISMRYLLVFEQPIIDVFREKGFMWNLHSGLLPGYKGMLVLYPAIGNGEKEYGLTLHETVAGIDEGGIVSMGALPLDPRRPVFDLYLDTIDMAAGMLAGALSQVAQGIIPQGVPQSGASGYYSNPTADAFRRYMERGIFYIDPGKTIQRVADAFARPGTALNDRLMDGITAFTAFLGAQSPREETRHLASVL